MTRLLQAVLFDLDGTIADTEPLWVIAKDAVASRHGIEWTAHDSQWAMGKPTPIYAEEFVRRGARGSTQDVATEITAHVAERVAAGVVWMPGALQLLKATTDAGIATALVTMAYRPVAEALARATGLAVFDVIIAGDDVVKSKPHPEPYAIALTELAELGVSPAACIAVEDTDTGARSAEGAGLRTLVVPSAHDDPATSEPRAGRSVRASLEGLTLDQLEALLQTAPPSQSSPS